MGVYDDHVLPRIINVGCNKKVATASSGPASARA